MNEKVMACGSADRCDSEASARAKVMIVACYIEGVKHLCQS